MKRILIVEDDKDIRESMRDLLKGEGYKVQTVSNGKEAMLYLKYSKQEPCLILLDLMMPISNGFDLMDMMNTAHMLVTIPVVVMSAASQIEKKLSEAKFYIKKPVNIDMLLNIVSTYCTNK